MRRWFVGVADVVRRGEREMVQRLRKFR